MNSIACLVLDFVTRKYYTVEELQKIQEERRKKHAKEIVKKEKKNNNKKKFSLIIKLI